MVGSAHEGLQVWGGTECTVNRVGDRYYSQLERNGHAERADDLERYAELGIKALRFPVLWERTAPRGLRHADWSWTDLRLRRLQELGIEPIAGLVHHGSGPRHTSLVDPAFPRKLAVYAAAVAKRYPWITHYTPVNEPVTTARFSGLYGVWYPHGRDERVFWRALNMQCRAVVLAMRAIRDVNPQAALVQTEDLGKTYSTPLLAYQAAHNNEVRWLCWDLLCGRVNRRHRLWRWLTSYCGATPRDLEWFERNACPPDLLGVNHYITSERLLDEDLSKYPARYHGGNRRHAYADIEASRSLAAPTAGISPLLNEAWKRYSIPIAITEAHIDSTRDDQLRWLTEIWRGAVQARAEGADIRAVTFWALLGSYDWNCLLTETRGYYEPGAYDVRGTEPRPTAVAKLMRELASGQEPTHPVLAGPGWWRREHRFFCPPVTLPRFPREHAAPAGSPSTMPPILVTGATGTLGRAFARICARRGLAVKLVNRAELDITDADSISRALDRHEPWAIVNTAGYVRVDEAEKDVERCFRENSLGPGTLAKLAARHGLPLVTFSSDLVFDGRQNTPYVESDDTAPLNVYGRSKAEAETRVLDKHPEALVVRTSSFFGPWDEYNYVTVALRALLAGHPFTAANDLTVSPTYVPDLVNTCLDLLIDREKGIWHLTNEQALTWAELAVRAAAVASIDPSPLQFCSSEALGYVARRPAYSALSSSRSSLMPTLDDALSRYYQHCEHVVWTQHRT